MLSEKQFDGLLNFVETLLTSEPEARTLIEKSGFSEDQLRIVGIVVAYGIRAYDALQEGGEFARS